MALRAAEKAGADDRMSSLLGVEMGSGVVALLNRPSNGFQSSGLGGRDAGEFASRQSAGHRKPRCVEPLVLANEPTV